MIRQDIRVPIQVAGGDEMINARQETIADIVAEMREFADTDSQSMGRDVLRRRIQHFARRFEAAWKRERESTREKSSAVGNSEAMREALLETQSVIAKCMDILNMIPSGVPYDGLIDDVADELGDLRDSCVNPALAVPPRNCDVGTTDDQIDRMLAFCVRKGKCSRCEHNKIGTLFRQCTLEWANEPYK